MLAAGRTGVALALCLAAAPAGAAERGCFAAADAMAAGRWAEAVTLLEARIPSPACAAEADNLRYSLGFCLERLDADEPGRACEAVDVYRSVAAETADRTIAAAAMAGVERSAALCARSRPAPKPPAAPPTATAPAAPATGPGPLRWILAGSAVGLAAAGGVLLYLGVQADGERADAEAIWLDPTASAAEAEAARRDFEDAGGRATTLGITGWAALAAAAGLGVAAAVVWSTDGPSVAVSPAGVSVGWTF